MGAAKSFPDLRVDQLARAAAAQIFEASGRFPREERYSLTDQIRRSWRATKARMSDCASDFCKRASETNYRGITMEEPQIWSAEIHDDSDAAI